VCWDVKNCVYQYICISFLLKCLKQALSCPLIYTGPAQQETRYNIVHYVQEIRVSKIFFFKFALLFHNVYSISLLLRNHKSLSTFLSFLSIKSALTMISEGSSNDVTQTTGVMMLKIQLCRHRNKLHFKIYSNRKLLF